MNPKLTRRRFIKGVIFSGAAASTGASFYLANAQSGQNAAERLITLNVNGRSRPVDVMPSETLAYTLRYKLDLTGTKLGIFGEGVVNMAFTEASETTWYTMRMGLNIRN